MQDKRKLKLKLKLKGFKDYLIWFIIWISFVAWISYASTWAIWSLFEKIWTEWKLVWTNIKNGTVWSVQLWTNSVTTVKIVDKNVTEAKLSDAIVAKLNSPIVTETDPLSVKLLWDQSIWWTKTFTSPVFWIAPTMNNHLVTKQMVDSAIASVLSSLFTHSWNIWTWSSCSVSCGWWIQVRPVACLRSDWTTVTDSFCTTTKPVTSQICNTSACTPSCTLSATLNCILN
jgi:hypothetical protein